VSAFLLKATISKNDVSSFLNGLSTAREKFKTFVPLLTSLTSKSLVMRPVNTNTFVIIIHHPYLIVLILHLVLHALVLFLFAILCSCPICLTIALFCLMLRHGLFLARY